MFKKIKAFINKAIRREIEACKRTVILREMAELEASWGRKAWHSH